MTDVFKHGPGVAATCLVAGFAQITGASVGLPSLILAILVGSVIASCVRFSALEVGTDLVADRVLKLGIALLGADLLFSDLATLGARPVVVALASVVLSCAVALGGARWIGRHWGFGLLGGGAVGICGTAAAAALGAILPRGNSGVTEADIAICMITVTVLSAIAVVAYPSVALMLHLSPSETGVFLGGTIHGVGQAIGAGHAVSDQVGQVATVTKLLRVACLVPVIGLTVWAARPAKTSPRRRTLDGMPLFLLGFVAMMGLRNAGLLPPALLPVFHTAAGLCLLAAMAALGLRTRLADMLSGSVILPLLITACSIFLLISTWLILLLQRTLT